tara:strand:+ start:318 stop:482 length:165 start_codon:yes stop_codon:yes gene_type:complete
VQVAEVQVIMVADLFLMVEQVEQEAVAQVIPVTLDLVQTQQEILAEAEVAARVI